MAYPQMPFTLEDLAELSTKPPLSTAPASLLRKLESFACCRVERLPVALSIATEMQRRGILRLAIHTGNAMVLCADFKKQQDRAWMRDYRGWHTCRVSRQHEAVYRLLFAAAPPKIGGRRGPSKGWTQRTKSTNRKCCIAYAKLEIITGVLTIGPLPDSAKLKSFQNAIQRALNKAGIIYHGIWEGPNPHLHILLCSPIDEATKKEIRGNIFACYSRHFGYRPQPPRTLVYLDLELRKGQLAAAHYCGKTRKKNDNGGRFEQKAKFPWLQWLPYFSHGLPWKAMKEVIANLPPTPPEFCEKERRRKKWDSRASKKR